MTRWKHPTRSSSTYPPRQLAPIRRSHVRMLRPPSSSWRQVGARPQSLHHDSQRLRLHPAAWHRQIRAAALLASTQEEDESLTSMPAAESSASATGANPDDQSGADAEESIPHDFGSPTT